jgi:hypothetical protein
MARQITDLERAKFVDPDETGDVAVRVFADNFSGTFTPSGLNVSGRVTEVTLSDSAWTALPTTALTNRNAISIQNWSGTQIKVNYNNGVSGYVGMVITGSGGERSYDITDDIVIYAKAQSGTPTITVEELA